jgi:hypothetical protein
MNLKSMNLSDEQKSLVRQWVVEGASLSDIQKRIKSDFQISCTYLELRFLLDDLKVVPKEKEQTKAKEKTSASDPLDAPQSQGGSTAAVRVSLDQITKPSALISGKVVFSDGEEAEWMIDHTGLPSIIPKRPGYRPSQKDIIEFQMQLQRMI